MGQHGDEPCGEVLHRVQHGQEWALSLERLGLLIITLSLISEQLFQIQITSLAMSDSSSDDLPIEHVVSPVKGKPQFDAAPRNVRYLFKLKDTKGKSYCLLEYTLMGGKKLPYITILKGFV